MEIEELEVILANESTTVNKIMSEAPTAFDPAKVKMWDVTQHNVFNKSKRKNKKVFVPTGEKNPDNTDKLAESWVYVNRIGLPLQKLLVRRAAAFICGNDVKLMATIEEGNTVQQAMFNAVSGNWKDNKLNFKNKDIVKMFLAETECAEIWYTVQKKVKGVLKNVLKMKIVAPSLGNLLYPVFDASGDMIAFGYTYQTDTSKFFWLYTDTDLRKYQVGATGNWELTETVPLIYTKIPVMYYSIDNPFWFDVQSCIERIETLLSNHGDTNDYFGSPMLKLKGKVNGVAAKGEAGKAFQMDENADVSFVTWDNSPESMVTEMNNLIGWIFGGKQVPNLSPEFLKSLGDISGAALDRILIDGHLLGMDYQDGMYGEMLQRRNNFLVAANAALDSSLGTAEDLDITNNFTLFRLNDDTQRIADASLASGGGAVISRKAAFQYANLTGNPDQDYQEWQSEQDALGAVNDSLV